MLTSLGLHQRFDSYLEQRTREATARSAALAQAVYADEGQRWTARGLDVLAHELVLTGYDVKLTSGGRTLLDTSKAPLGGGPLRQVSREVVRGSGGKAVGQLRLFALGPRGNLAADNTLRAELDRAHLVAAAIAAAVAIVAGLVFAGTLSRPLRRLAAAARGISNGERPSAEFSGSPEVRDLGEALTSLAADLDGQERSRRQLAQDFSHEVRTPLMILQSRIEAMQDGVVPFDAEGLTGLHTETLRLSRLVGQIELLAEAEAQPCPLDLQPVALDEVAREAADALAPSFDLVGMALEVTGEPTQAFADREAVRQILTNLLGNALKYAPSRSSVRVSTSFEGNRAVLRVRDEGELPPGACGERLFDRFYRGTAAASQASGTGLGLTIARGLAVSQGGELVIEEEKGSCFVLRLPVPRDRPRGGGPLAQSADATPPHPPGPTRR